VPKLKIKKWAAAIFVCEHVWLENISAGMIANSPTSPSNAEFWLPGIFFALDETDKLRFFVSAKTMNSNHHLRTLALSALGVLIVSAFFYVLVGRCESANWPANAVHNWNQYGFGVLHGKMVTNPGGFEALTKPDIYKGHRAASFYAVFAVGKLLGWLGDGVMMFHLVFTLALFASIWFLLGRSGLALVGAAAAVLCPGYSVYPTIVDPNAVALYTMVPFAAVTVHFLSAKDLPPLKLMLLAVLTFTYTSLNWSTAFGHGILFCALLVMPAISWSRLGIYTGLAGVSVGVVGALSVLDKMGDGNGAAAAGGGSFLTFLAGYTWGHVGYGADLTTIKAAVRLGAVNSAGLLPLIFFAIWLAVKIRGSNRAPDVLAFLPFAAAVLGVMTLRNYFGHHPWMAAPMLLPGLVLSLCLLVKRNAPEKIAGVKTSAGPVFLAGCLLYAVTVLGAHRAYHSEAMELSSLVRQHTARTDTIALVESLDPQIAAQWKSLSESCDRHVVVLSDLNAPPADENIFVLSATDLNGQLPVVAKSEKSVLLTLPLIRELSEWYKQKISRRDAQDRHFDFTAGATFVLYHLPPPVR
jgi:hypothetical protein